MRLINTATLQLEDFTLRDIPPYAILSHTWADDEVTFQDMIAGNESVRAKQGFTKIVKTCQLAIDSGLDYAWLDTCCIDKSSSAELTESINSMFEYYARSHICFAYLADLVAGSDNMGACRWFSRGWTLQELIAPGDLVFCDQTWKPFAAKSELVDVLAEITRVPRDVLLDASSRSAVSVAARMSWAADRQTTRTEDVAYSLLGIFDVNMPLIYGEGRKAFRRLQEEIVKRDNDLTIFAWEPSSDQEADEANRNLLAVSPSTFSNSATINTTPDQSPEFSITNKGLLVSPDTPVGLFSVSNDPQASFLGICLGYGSREGHVYSGRVFLHLQRIGPRLYCPNARHSLIWFEPGRHKIRWLAPYASYHVMMEAMRAMSTYDLFRHHSISLPVQPGCGTINWAVPERLWDPEGRTFLRPFPFAGSFFPVVLAVSLQVRLAQGEVTRVIICDNTAGHPRVGVAVGSTQSYLEELVSSQGPREESLTWSSFNELGLSIDWQSDQGRLATVQGMTNHWASPRGHSIVVNTTTSATGTRAAKVSVHLEDNVLYA